MRVLICYASTEGQTRKICRFCTDQLFASGHSVELLSVTDADTVELALFDAVILAGSVHLGKLQPELVAFASAHAPALNAKPGLLLQVSLAAAGAEPEDMKNLEQIAAQLSAETGWTPDAVHQIAGAFRFGQYDFFKSWAMRYLAQRKGQSVDPKGDTEYTDWPVLAAILKEWSRGLS